MTKGACLEINQLHSKFLSSDISRFILVGSITVLIDFLIYFLLLLLNIDIALSKGIGFSIGALFAYFSNRSYTFQSSQKGLKRFVYFAFLYISTLIANVVSNEIILHQIGNLEYSLLISFFIATAISATLNFLGMKYYVFSPNGTQIK